MPNSFLANPTSTKETLKRWELHTKKSLGQHFLVDDAIVGKILELSEVNAGEKILEVGPGIGTLTAGIVARGANVVAIERDHELLCALRDNVCLAADGDSSALTLLEMDALDLDIQILENACFGGENNSQSEADPIHPAQNARSESFQSPQSLQRFQDLQSLPHKFVANLPYAVAATIVLEYLQKLNCINMVCVMVQAEVANRMCALPCTKDYGAYTVKLGLSATPKSSFSVKPGSFLPPPHVDSKVIRLDRRTDICDSHLLETACMLADAAFLQRRKTIRNSMRSYFATHKIEANNDVMDAMFERCNVDPRSRGESHSIDAYLYMAKDFLSLTCS